MNASNSGYGFKAFFLNALIIACCAAPKFGWACFLLLAAVYSVATFRFASTKSNFIACFSVLTLAAVAYFSAYRFNQSTTDMPAYYLGVAAIQLVVLVVLVSFYHFRIFKPNREFIKAGV